MTPELDQIRLITCGSVDDGKSTLLGRLLYETHQIYEDQLAALERDSKVSGTTGGGLDLALLTDGLAAEREQGITIDVAYRFYATDRRRYIIADTPGHEQYTRNMATGSSSAQLAPTRRCPQRDPASDSKASPHRHHDGHPAPCPRRQQDGLSWIRRRNL